MLLLGLGDGVGGIEDKLGSLFGISRFKETFSVLGDSIIHTTTRTLTRNAGCKNFSFKRICSSNVFKSI